MIITGEENELFRGMSPFLFKSNDRGNLNCFWAEGGTAVACNGQQLAMTTRNILPDGIWRIVKSLKKQTELEKVDGDYPNWKQVMPDTMPAIHTVSPATHLYDEGDASIYLCRHGLYTQDNGKQCAYAYRLILDVMELANAAHRKTMSVHQQDAYTPRLFDMGDVKAIVMPLWMGR